jgi:hypothetical protein
MNKYFVIIILIGYLIFPCLAEAKYDPRVLPNNKFGMHIIDSNDLNDAVWLANSSGGQWGYVTIVISETDKNSGKWQTVMNELRRKRLIPIIRLASTSENDYWTIPTDTASDDWVRFLNSLNWPTENRYVAIFNEPNHAKEWGNTINPENYSDRFLYLAQRLRQSTDDYFILPAAMDASAVTAPGTMDAGEYIKRMVSSHPEMLEYIDGLNSHSYPNPHFSGHPAATGRGSLRTYEWERSLFRSLGLTRDLPVFITETGWQHQNGKIIDYNLLDSETVGQYLGYALENVWSDPDIVAVTPFLLNYQDYPFDHFSWKNYGSTGFYSFSEIYRNYPKTTGKPKQKHIYRLSGGQLPNTLAASSVYKISIKISNYGQDIIDPEIGYVLQINSTGKLKIIPDRLPVIEPENEALVTVKIVTPHDIGIFNTETFMNIAGSEIVPIQTSKVDIVPPPDLEINYKLAWKKALAANGIKLLIYDNKETLLHEIAGITSDDGTIYVTNLQNIIPGDRYRLVVLIPGYLPQQTYMNVANRGTKVSLPRFLPLDFVPDETFNFQDLVKALKTSPYLVLRRFY